MIRVGFLSPYIRRTIGAYNYIRNLFDAIYNLPDRKIEVVIIAGTRDNPKLFKEFPPVQILRTRLLDRNPLSVLRNRMWQTFQYDPFLQWFLIKHHISVLSHSGYLGIHSKTPSIGWIPDFQHIHLPEFFTPKELTTRDRTLINICRYCKGILVSSRACQQDLERFAPQYVHKSFVLHFVGGSLNANEGPGIEELKKIYQFETPYFYVPNQFWAHKNHRVVIEALSIIKSKGGPEIQVLATGPTADARQPDYFTSLMDYAQEKDVLDNFKVLGFVPYAHVLSLSRHCLAMLNPSFFEGWSTSVEEAKTLGKRIILSDIPVHREQSPPAGVYFNPKDAHSLADAMLSSLYDFDSIRESELKRQAIKDYSFRRDSFGQNYQNIVIRMLCPRK